MGRLLLQSTECSGSADSFVDAPLSVQYSSKVHCEGQEVPLRVVETYCAGT